MNARKRQTEYAFEHIVVTIALFVLFGGLFVLLLALLLGYLGVWEMAFTNPLVK